MVETLMDGWGLHVDCTFEASGIESVPPAALRA